MAPQFTDRLVQRWAGSRFERLPPHARDARCPRRRAGAHVGGWVRDRLMGRASKDIDIEVYGVSPADLRSLLQRFGPVNTVGESFTVYKVADVDVSLPRRESKMGRGHRGFDVTGDPTMSVEDASRRRDFTINAISWDPLRDEYVDPFDGRGDIAAGILRVVDPRTFPEDSLRVLRAISWLPGSTCRDATASAAIPLDDLPSERSGASRKLLFAERPSTGSRRDGSGALPPSCRRRRLPAGAGMASGGRRLVHTLR
jgi:tRNA nucleotidyltransferase (CCA-adding enzyme)